MASSKFTVSNGGTWSGLGIEISYVAVRDNRCLDWFAEITVERMAWAPKPDLLEDCVVYLLNQNPLQFFEGDVTVHLNDFVFAQIKGSVEVKETGGGNGGGNGGNGKIFGPFKIWPFRLLNRLLGK